MTLVKSPLPHNLVWIEIVIVMAVNIGIAQRILKPRVTVVLGAIDDMVSMGEIATD
jgi:hypothetical protein